MVENGKFVQIEYTGKFDNGDVFDTNVGQQPLEFQVGSGTVISGLDNQIIGMKIDEEKEITIEPKEGYGEYNEAFVLNVPKQEIQSNFDPEIGMVISVQMENGSQVPARITEINNDIVIIDLNHPLAGKNLHFTIKIIDLNDVPQISNDSCDCSDDSCNNGCSGEC